MRSSLLPMQKRPTELTQHPLWRSLQALDPGTLKEVLPVAYNPFGGGLRPELPSPPPSVRGGILAGKYFETMVQMRLQEKLEVLSRQQIKSSCNHSCF